jgi:GNAT superfamily N-acetyltransferase
MAVHLYPISPDHDYPRLAELIHRVTGVPISAECLRQQDDSTQSARIRWQIVAVEEGRVVGYADTWRDAEMAAGRFQLTLAVEPERRGRGIGAMLLDDALTFAWEQGGSSLAWCFDMDQAEAVRFAERHGFLLDVETGNASPAGAAASHRYVLTLDGRGGIPEDQAELFTLIRRLSHELPDLAGVTPACSVACSPLCEDTCDDAPDVPDDAGSLWSRMLSLSTVGCPC